MYTKEEKQKAIELANINETIDKKTKEVVAEVKGAEDYNISTAVFINGEFTLISDFDINNSYSKALKMVAIKLDAYFTY